MDMDTEPNTEEVTEIVWLHFPCNCIAETAPLHCHGCDEALGRFVPWWKADCPEHPTLKG